jgi:hypothetical protein
MNKDTIWKAQLAALREIEINLISLIKVAKETQGRIQSGGLNHNYSSSHDCYDYAVKVWKNSLRLSELKKLEYDVTGLDPWGMPKKEKPVEKQKSLVNTKKKKKSKKK